MRKSVAKIAINPVGALTVLALCAGVLALQPVPAQAQGLGPLNIFLDPPILTDPCKADRSWLNFLQQQSDRLR